MYLKWGILLLHSQLQKHKATFFWVWFHPFWKSPCTLPVLESCIVRKVILRIVDTILPRQKDTYMSHSIICLLFNLLLIFNFDAHMFVQNLDDVFRNQCKLEGKWAVLSPCHSMLHGELQHLAKTQYLILNILNWVWVTCQKNLMIAQMPTKNRVFERVHFNVCLSSFLSVFQSFHDF